MAKLTINDVTSGYASTTALNTAFTAIETALENTLSRDGTSPNSMSANLDMNGYAILNARATSGNENFLWMGTWATGTSYAVNNLVYAPEGSNVGATLICVTAHIAGATLDGDSTKWAVFAQRGASGAGTGDVVGPASSTADSLARFSGTTGKLLKDGAVVGTDIQAYSANLTAFSALTTGTASGNVPLIGTASATESLAGLVELSTSAETVTGTDTTRATHAAGVKAAIDAAIAGSTVLTASGDLLSANAVSTYSANRTHNEAHGLGVVPVGYTIGIRCVDAGGDIGYAQNEEVMLNGGVFGGGTQTGNAWCNSTSVGFTTGNAISASIASYVVHKTTGATGGITLSKWKFIFRAWA